MGNSPLFLRIGSLLRVMESKLQSLDREIQYFCTDSKPLPAHEAAFKSVIQCLSYDGTSRQRRSEKKSLCLLLRQIHERTGRIVPLLCTFGISKRLLLRSDSREFISRLHQWWKARAEILASTDFSCLESFISKLEGLLGLGVVPAEGSSTQRTEKLPGLDTLGRNEPGYCTRLIPSDLHSFLALNGNRVGELRIRISADHDKPDCIEMSPQMRQELIMYASHLQDQRVRQT